ncbi:hypothetical protein CLHOM_24240 [Clostridium homopropionicum DSM 5847]|uniref:Cyclic nucleotide-binding domain-containing protein n=2 Tax=Clostridium TaxID=1485 RepID=A0A0L6Z963_9CLOT|nr:hypothetical protein [Clostridium homopropionicum]KOA19318.1 hypothetical protein CLHOM_24240 [Clostridium homopropionicum DSM 5847]SFG20918.1 hypothetical protein SAMN04488501_106184 [Clostridium homopropionicum]
MNKIEKCRLMIVATLKELTDLNVEAISELVLSIPIQTYKKGTVLLNQGDKPDMSYYLLMGLFVSMCVMSMVKKSLLIFI